MKPIYFAAILALLGSVVVSTLVRPLSVDERLVQLQLSRVLPAYAHELSAESTELRAQFVDYADDTVLAAKARIALIRYPDMARPIFARYGDQPEFQRALRDHGEHILLPIHYFMTHDIRSVAWMEKASSKWSELRRLWSKGELTGSEDGGPRQPLTAEQRGWYAVIFVRHEGHDFLGQFVVGEDGEVKWIQSERISEALSSFFTGGIRGLETKYKRNEVIGAGDIGWAGLDLAVGVSAVKILRLGRAGLATSARSMTYAQRSAALGASLVRGSRVGMRVAKYGGAATLAYLAVRHPKVLHALFGKVAELIGVPVWVVQVLGWSLVLWPVMWLLTMLLGPLVLSFKALAKAVGWCEGLARRRRCPDPA